MLKFSWLQSTMGGKLFHCGLLLHASFAGMRVVSVDPQSSGVGRLLMVAFRQQRW
jgi:hypothetical protein